MTNPEYEIEDDDYEDNVVDDYVPDCPKCGGTGMNWDDTDLCEHCDGEGYEWWL